MPMLGPGFQHAAEVRMSNATWMQSVMPQVVNPDGRSGNIPLEANRDDPPPMANKSSMLSRGESMKLARPHLIVRVVKIVRVICGDRARASFRLSLYDAQNLKISKSSNFFAPRVIVDIGSFSLHRTTYLNLLVDEQHNETRAISASFICKS